MCDLLKSAVLCKDGRLLLQTRRNPPPSHPSSLIRCQGLPTVCQRRSTQNSRSCGLEGPCLPSNPSCTIHQVLCSNKHRFVLHGIDFSGRYIEDISYVQGWKNAAADTPDPSTQPAFISEMLARFADRLPEEERSDFPVMWTREPMPWPAYLSTFLQSLEADPKALSNAVGGP